ncbi:uncharacterized protein LOC120197965 isoform X1 [Hibiscus syriacus]|uniref:uncharacterized protein LOC120197965 isoform X1 n=1 Tax=Hibiscus syriacus TaxID=106335 RepID=UPI0019231318|nr:uncharacterized protein LOC120197965 isoform X1 [Hibiscus syriacus]
MSSLTRKHRCLKLKRKIAKKTMTARFRRLKSEMEKISIEQQVIKEGQRQVGTKIEEINEQCEQLRQETKQIIRQSVNTQIRLALMFNILKAREEGDFAKTCQLTRLLREIMVRE